MSKKPNNPKEIGQTIKNSVKVVIVHKLLMEALEQYFHVEIQDVTEKLGQYVHVILRSRDPESNFLSATFYYELDKIFNHGPTQYVFKAHLKEAVAKLMDEIFTKNN